MGLANGANIKSIGYVENIVAAALFLMERMAPGIEIYNYADSPHMTTRALIECIAKTLRVKVPRFAFPRRWPWHARFLWM